MQLVFFFFLLFFFRQFRFVFWFYPIEMKIQFTILLIELGKKNTPKMLNARRLSWRLGFRLYKLVKIRWARCTQCCFWFPRIFLGRLIRTIDNLNMQVCSSRDDCYWNALCTLDWSLLFMDEDIIFIQTTICELYALHSLNTDQDTK